MAIDSGFRNSGITVGKRGKIMLVRYLLAKSNSLIMKESRLSNNPSTQIFLPFPAQKPSVIDFLYRVKSRVLSFTFEAL